MDEFDYEYTANSSAQAIAAKRASGEEPPVMSESLNLFKALQVRQEPLPVSEASTASSRADRRGKLREVYAEDDQAMLICYRQVEVLIFLSTVGALLALVVIVAVTCCMRVRKLSSSHTNRIRSPSTLSISDSIAASTGSLLASSGPLSSPVSANSSLVFQATKRSPILWPKLPYRAHLAAANRRQLHSPGSSTGSNLAYSGKSTNFV